MGFPPKHIYPLDVDRAFKALDRIKPQIAAWAATSTQAISLCQTGEVDFSFTISSRVKATTEAGGGVPLAFSFEQNLFSYEGASVLKGAPNKQSAMRLVAYLLRPEVQVRLMDGYGDLPISRNAATMSSASTGKWQADLNNPESLFVNSGYWADNLEALSVRFHEWVLN
ncbi:extracellular solute-binding protein [Bradyrhizobium sp. CCBAU 21360]|uniref:extracellular solute-binding protein n=1 Tax=Bradyrhizobium sp. CCBAU 21360 TaxID=1325081 RepID=UPI002305019A|nr:extracellular solute-binding protein [Bradyrhizobium sp. CCBAU 21360]